MCMMANICYVVVGFRVPWTFFAVCRRRTKMTAMYTYTIKVPTLYV